MSRRNRKNAHTRPQNKKTKTRIAVVFEDSKSSLDYIKAIRGEYAISKRNLYIVHRDNRTDIISLNKQLDKCTNSDRNGGFDKKYIVIDQENKNDKGFFEEIKNIENEDKNKKVIYSNPSVEIWFLLHFRDSSTPYRNAKAVENELKRKIAEYDKSELDKIYKKYLKDRTDVAIKNAKKLEKENLVNPMTKMHVLIEHIQKMRDER